MLERKGSGGPITARLDALRHELKADIAALRAEVKTDIAELRADLRADLRDEISGVRATLGAQIDGVRKEAKEDAEGLREGLHALAMEFKEFKGVTKGVAVALTVIVPVVTTLGVTATNLLLKPHL